MSRLESGLERLRLWDLALCVRFNGAVRIAPVRRVFRIVSRLGDGVFWYSLMLALLATGGADAFGPVGSPVPALDDGGEPKRRRRRDPRSQLCA